MREQKRSQPASDEGAAAPQPAGDGEDGQLRAAAAQKHQARKHKGGGGADAETYNEKHSEQVQEFNRLTKNACVGEDGKLDVGAVEKWQSEHGVEPDGKVGKQTLAAAGAPPEAAHGKDAATGQASGKRQYDPMDDFLDWFDVEEAYRFLAELGSMMMGPAPKDEDHDDREDKKPIEETGLASNLAVGEFVAAAQHIEKNWKKYTPQERAAKMVHAANEQLQAAGVLQAKHQFDPKLTEFNPGKFKPDEWSIHLSKSLFHEKRLKPEDGITVATAIYHEARHAEQNYRVVQLLAGQGKTAEQIQQVADVDPKAIADGIKKPMVEDGGGAALGKAIYDDKYGAGREHHGETMTAAREKVKQWAEVQKRAQAAKTPEDREAAKKELEALKPEVKAAYDAYKALASESDAFGTENKVAAAMTKK